MRAAMRCTGSQVVSRVAASAVPASSSSSVLRCESGLVLFLRCIFDFLPTSALSVHHPPLVSAWRPRKYDTVLAANSFTIIAHIQLTSLVNGIAKVTVRCFPCGEPRIAGLALVSSLSMLVLHCSLLHFLCLCSLFSSYLLELARCSI